MNEEEMITTYKEFEEAIKNGERKLVKGMGRLQTYQGLEYIKKLLENDKYYCEELEDSFVAISSYVDNKEKENKQLQNNWNELKRFVEERMKELNPAGLEIGRFNIQNDDYTMGQYGVYQSTLNKMQELE